MLKYFTVVKLLNEAIIPQGTPCMVENIIINFRKDQTLAADKRTLFGRVGNWHYSMF